MKNVVFVVEGRNGMNPRSIWRVIRHADPSEHRKKHWWVGQYHYRVRKYVPEKP